MICAGFDKAPHLLVAGTLLVSAFNGKVRADLLFLGNLITTHAMNLSSWYSGFVLAPSKNPKEVWGAPAKSRLTALGWPQCLQMDSGGEWGNEVWADLRSERNLRLQL